MFFFGNNLSQFFDAHENGTSFNKFNFTDDPNTKKLIIIDGDESDFRTLDQLAKSNRLKIVDQLQPDTAISIYGKKQRMVLLLLPPKILNPK